MRPMKRLILLAAACILCASLLLAHGEAPPSLKLHMISGSREYQSETSLVVLKAYLERHYRIECTLSLAEDKGTDLPGIESLAHADVMLIFCRRVEPPRDQVQRIKAWCEAGKPVIGIRTASHGLQNWLEFDKVVLGGDCKGHGGEEELRISVNPDASRHPILAGVEDWTRVGKLYRNANLAESVTVLMTGAGKNDKQPVAWAWTYDKDKTGRSFYTSLGYPDDFENMNFRRLLVNAISWTARRQIERKAPFALHPVHATDRSAERGGTMRTNARVIEGF